jgi:hypothetical protein
MIATGKTGGILLRMDARCTRECLILDRLGAELVGCGIILDYQEWGKIFWDAGICEDANGQRDLGFGALRVVA